MLKWGAEIILTTMLLPWVVWATVSLFASQSADAVQETKLEQIKSMLEEVREDVREIKRR